MAYRYALISHEGGLFWPPLIISRTENGKYMKLWDMLEKYIASQKTSKYLQKIF